MIAPPRTARLAACLLAAAWLAGCAGADGKDRSGKDGPDHAPTGAFTKDTCAIDGFVVDAEDQLGLPDANVGIINVEPAITSVSATDGSFSFSRLEPGTLTLAASKPGYEPAVASVTCLAGAAIENQILGLLRVPEPAVAYYLAYQPMTGRVGCSVGFYSVSTQDACKPVNAAAQTTLTLHPDTQPITGAVYEMKWTPNAGLFGGKYLALLYPGAILATEPSYTTDDKHSEAGDTVQGRSPVNLRIESLDPATPLYLLPEEGTMQFMVRAAGSKTDDIVANPLEDGSSKVVYDQPFEIYVALFYNGQAIPDGYTGLPES